MEGNVNQAGEGPGSAGWHALPEQAPARADRSGRDHVILLSRAGEVMHVNSAVLEFTGWSREVVLGRPLWAVAPSAAARERLRSSIAQAAGGAEVNIGERIADRHGNQRLLDFSLTPVTGDDDHIDLLILVARDVTETTGHHELVASREKYFGIVNTAADAIISVDAQYRMTDFNRGAEQIFGYSAAEAVGRSLDILIPERFRAVHVEHMRSFGRSPVAARRMGERREISALHKDGREFPADASISKQVVDGRQFYTVVLRDMTRQKRAERAQRFLARAGSMLASSLDVSTTLETIARLAADDVMADCCVIFDASEAHVMRRAALAAASAASAPFLDEHRGESLSSESAHPATDVVNTGRSQLIRDTRSLLDESRDDRDLALMRELGVTSAIVVPLIARGRTGGAIALYRTGGDNLFGPDDLALAEELAVVSALAVDNARLYESARRAVRARDDILAVVSHDLGNPLAAVRIGTAVLARDLAETRTSDSVQEHLRGVRRSVDQMDRLIRDLMDVERLEAGPLRLGAKPVRATTVVSSVIDMFNPIAAGKPVALRSRVPANLPAIRADRDRLVQALSNLVGNAIKFTQPHGTVEIAVEPGDDALLFSVSDDGPGIDPGNLEHIFDRFWKSARLQRESEGGLGLGLAIVKGIIEAHGGRVWAESEPGHGTRIRFTIPLSGPGVPDRPATVRPSPTS